MRLTALRPAPNNACELSPLAGIPVNLDPPGPVAGLPAIRLLSVVVCVECVPVRSGRRRS
jgi:hypothetical protein